MLFLRVSKKERIGMVFERMKEEDGSIINQHSIEERYRPDN
jgi:hypothetical protein